MIASEAKPAAPRQRAPRPASEHANARQEDSSEPLGQRIGLIKDGVALLTVVVGLLFGIVVFLPAEGRIAGPLHDLVVRVFGRASFMLPLWLVSVGGITLLRTLVPELQVSRLRVAGLGLACLALMPTLHFVGQDAGLSLERALAGEGGGFIGHWIGNQALDWLGGPLSLLLLLGVAFVAALMMFRLTVAQVMGGAAAGLGWVHTTVVEPLWAHLPRKLPARPSLPRPRIRLRIPISRQPGEERTHARPRGDARPLPDLKRRSRPGGHVLPPTRLQRPSFDSPVEDEPDRDELEDQSEAAPSITEGQSISAARVAKPGVGTAVAPQPMIRPLPAGTTPAEWRKPTLDVFAARTDVEVSQADLKARAAVIEETLASFNIEARVVEANQGPAITQFGVEPAEGVAVNKILSRQNDIALRLGVSPIRLEAPVPGKRMVGVEVPNGSVATVTVRDVVESSEWEGAKGKLRLALGRDVSGTSIVADLGRMPHLLIAGATGAGKSVCINTIIGSLLYQFTPDEMQILMIDPKRVELVQFNDIPHLRLPVIVEMDKVVGALKWVVQEMERRYKLFSQHGVRNLEGYNRWVRESTHVPEGEEPLPYLVVVVDELADMMMTAADQVEKLLCRLAQLARATGIHLVVATQRPSVDVLTGLIKANFPTRIAFAVSSQTDSRVILDQAGAEKLLGRGDALFMPPEAMKPIRLQGSYVSDDEIRSLVDLWKSQGGPRYTAADLQEVEALGRGEDEDGEDDVYDRAVELAETVGRLSVSLLQRRLGIGKARAERLLDRLIDEGVAEE